MTVAFGMDTWDESFSRWETLLQQHNPQLFRGIFTPTPAGEMSGPWQIAAQRFLQSEGFPPHTASLDVLTGSSPLLILPLPPRVLLAYAMRGPIPDSACGSDQVSPGTCSLGLDNLGGDTFKKDREMNVPV